MSPAHARVYDLYRADYPKGHYCSAIGGACAADPDLENSFFQNPAALTAREPTWAFDGDYNGSSNLEPGMKESNDVSESSVMGGIGWAGDLWGMAIAFSGRQERVASSVSVVDENGFTQRFPLAARSRSFDLRIPLAFRASHKFSLGGAVSASLWSQTLTGENGSRAVASPQSAPIQWGFRFGGIYQPLRSDWEFGSWFKLPSTRNIRIELDTQAYSNQIQYREELALHDPWIWAVGARWNPGSRGKIFLAELDAIGPTTDGFLLNYDTFAAALGEGRIREKGRTVAIQPRIGFQAPIDVGLSVPPRLLLGSFYETSRRSGLRGRLHATMGIAYQAFSGIELMIGGDFAKDFTQIFFTFR
ncbi:MAG: hypothetical protein H7301_05105 [Cryobacterium sp.]|nr:hypothetical protein [Oligoflexia bacterium]